MTTHKGNPSGINKSEGTGVPRKDMAKKDLAKDKELGREFTDKDDIADNVQHNNPNRNVDKTDATNAGGYKQ